MAELFDRASVILTSTNITDVYQAPSASASGRVIVLSCMACNVSTSDSAYITLRITDSTNVEQSRFANTILVPGSSTLEAIPNKLILLPGEKVRAVANVADRLHVTMSVVEIS